MNPTRLDVMDVAPRGSTEMPLSAALPAPRSPVLETTETSVQTVVVLVADPDRSTREPLAGGLTAVGVGNVVQAGSAEAVADLVRHRDAGDLALVSLGFGPEAAGLITSLREAGWTRVIALAPTADIGPVIDAVGAGVTGVLIGRRANPAAASLPSSIHDLSSREVEVIRLVADGRSNKWIGDELSLSALTVKSHLARIGRKLGTGDRAHMVALAMRAGVIS
jgi:DNA-binding NarL/FixJ family response regulator